MTHTVNGHCPACRHTSLILGAGGHVTCSRLDCPDPCAADTQLQQHTTPTGPTTNPRDTLVEQLAERCPWLTETDVDAILNAYDREHAAATHPDPISTMHTALGDIITLHAGNDTDPHRAQADYAAVTASAAASIAGDIRRLTDSITTALEHLARIEDAIRPRGAQHNGACTATRTERIGIIDDTSIVMHCRYKHGHTGAHRSTNSGDTWTDPQPTRPTYCKLCRDYNCDHPHTDRPTTPA